MPVAPGPQRTRANLDPHKRIRKLALMKHRLSPFLTLVVAIPCFSATAVEITTFNAPVNVIFDTDMCLDPDDAMALAIVHALHNRHEVNLVAVTVSLDESWCAPYVDVLNTFYGHPD